MKPLKLNYFIIPGISIFETLANGLATAYGSSWYKTLQAPPFSPSLNTFSTIWATIFTLTMSATLIIWNTFDKTIRFWVIIIFLLITTLAITAWNYIFFYNHLLGIAALNQAIMLFSSIILFLLIRPISRITAFLLFPYVFWNMLLMYYTLMLWALN